MRNGRSGIINMATAGIGALSIVMLVHIVGVGAMGEPPVSGKVSLVPQRWDMLVMPLAEAELPRTADGSIAVTGQQAIQATTEHWGISSSDIDPAVGAVRALFRRVGQDSSRPRKVWIVTANAEVMSQGPAASRHFVSDKLCTIIDAETGQYIMAYAAGTKTYVDGGKW